MRDIPFSLRQLGEGPKRPPRKLRSNVWLKQIKAILSKGWHAVEQTVLFAHSSYLYLALSLFVALVFSRVVPYNTDEFIHYHTLVCRAYPFNALNVFTGACGALDLNFLNTGLILPLRAYLYSGSFPSLYYLPFFWLWPSPVSARLLNILFLLAQAVVLGKLFRLSPWRAFLGLLLFFPYAFQHVVDTGPVSFQLLSVYCIALLFDRWMKQPSFLWPLLAASLAFLALWTKLIYLALLPGILGVFIITVIPNRSSFMSSKSVSRLSAQILVGIFVILALTSTLLLSTNPSDPTSHPFIEQLLQKGEHYSLPELITNLPTLDVTKALLNPFAATHRVYDVWPVTQSGLAKVFVLLMYAGVPLFSLCALGIKELRGEAWKPLALYALFPVTFLLIARTKLAWAMHHAVLSFPFLILAALALFVVLRHAQSKNGIRLRKIWHVWVGLFFAVNLFWFALFPSQSVRSSDDFSKERINAMLHNEALGSQYFYVVTDWGMYFYQGLYGPKNQGVLYVSGIYKQSDFDALKKIADEHGRKLLFIVNQAAKTTDIPLMKSKMWLDRCAALPADAAWQVWYEPTSIGSGVCMNAR